MLESLISKMILRGASREEVLATAITLSREAFQKLTDVCAKLDHALGSQQFRRDTIEPLLEKERQINSIKARAARGGAVRTSDKNLVTLLYRCNAEYESLRDQFPWASLTPYLAKLVESYIEERRIHLQLGDAERVRTAYDEALGEAAAA